MKTVLTIAGFDPSSGAGMTADLIVFAAHGLFGTACPTALTVQSTVGVAGMHPVDAGFVRATLDHLTADLPPAGIKIGMLASAEIVREVAEFLEGQAGVPVVLDPVVRSSSGAELLPATGVELMRERLLPMVTVVTPNLMELAVLAGERVAGHDEMAMAARRLQQRYAGLSVLATGGHLDRPDDLLVTADGEESWLRGEWVRTRATHGTGCALSSSLLSKLARGEEMGVAAAGAKAYVVEAMRRAEARGQGAGPMELLWPLRQGIDARLES